jgi:hypothetical protein
MLDRNKVSKRAEIFVICEIFLLKGAFQNEQDDRIDQTGHQKDIN